MLKFGRPPDPLTIHLQQLSPRTQQHPRPQPARTPRRVLEMSCWHSWLYVGSLTTE